jgi:hypothetical protein
MTPPIAAFHCDVDRHCDPLHFIGMRAARRQERLNTDPMAKTLKTRAELEAAINAELAKYDVCQGITVAIEKITDQRFDYNWDVHSSRASGTTLLPECLEVLRQVVQLLQEKYDLALES